MVYWEEIKKLNDSNDHALTSSPTKKSPTKFPMAGEQFEASPPLALPKNQLQANYELHSTISIMSYVVKILLKDCGGEFVEDD